VHSQPNGDAGVSAVIEYTLTFGPFQLLPGQRLLLQDRKPMKLGSRAMDILIALVDRAGDTVDKQELMAVVWPRTVVEEGALRVHVAALRKLLGDGQAGARYIVNVPGRGYSFIAPLVRTQLQQTAVETPSANEQANRLPASLTRVVGRGDTVAMLASQLPMRRLVTLVGPGGIGKTTVAVAVVDIASGDYQDGAYFVDFASVTDAELVAATVSSTLGLGDAPEKAARRISTFISEKNLLIVFDNCEHVLAAVALLIESMLRESPGLRVLATSREPLRAEGEWLHHLPALTTPPPEVRAASVAMNFSAFDLFVERATANLDSFDVTDRDVLVISDLCRRLDGNPLAIELTAARVGAFGLRGLAEHLEAHVLHLKQVRRTAMARHQTLGAVLDWSYQLLTAEERLALTRLAIFRGRFSLQAATALLAPLVPTNAREPSDILNLVADLGAKSWLSSDVSREIVHYLWLELTHAYALTKLKESGEYDAIAVRHARYVYDLMSVASDAWTDLSLTEWAEEYLWVVDDVRAALAWCFASDGDVLLGISLTALVAPMSSHFNAFDVPGAINRAIQALALLPEPRLDLEVRLSSALLFAPPHERSQVTAPEVLALAQKSGEPKLFAETLIAVVLRTSAEGSYTNSVAQTEQLSVAARQSGDPGTIVVADRINAQIQHYAGHNRAARILAERVLRNPIQRAPLRTRAAGLDHAVSMRIVLSRILWLEGFADQAWSLAGEARNLAARQGTLARCQVLSLCSCAIALWRGDTQLAREYSAELHAAAQEHLTRTDWLATVARIPWYFLWDETSEPEQSLNLRSTVLHFDHLLTVDAGLVTHEAATRTLSDHSWASAEILRAYGEKVSQRPSAAAKAEAQTWFERSLEISREQGALAWELRAATSLATLWRDLGRTSHAEALLAPVYQRITEGFKTVDVARAERLLDSLSVGE
jgi:predicted ATPase/DNA-binding winged helix-turn-helix (wHTH) protein